MTTVNNNNTFFNDNLDSGQKLADKRDAQLVDCFSLSHDVRYMRFRFLGLKPDQVVGLPAGRHLHFSSIVYDPVINEMVELARSYSPVSDADANSGEVEFLVKVYAASDADPRLGIFSRHLNAMEVGAILQMSGPWGRLFYLGECQFGEWTGARTRHHRVGMVAGGAGIAPMIRIIREFIREIDENVKAQIREFSLIYTNKTNEDVLFREELETYAREYSRHFRLLLTLTKGVFTEPSSSTTCAMPRIKSWMTFMERPRSQPNLLASCTAAKGKAAGTGGGKSPVNYLNGRINERMFREVLPALGKTPNQIASGLMRSCSQSAAIETNANENCENLALIESDSHSECTDHDESNLTIVNKENILRKDQCKTSNNFNRSERTPERKSSREQRGVASDQRATVTNDAFDGIQIKFKSTQIHGNEKKSSPLMENSNDKEINYEKKLEIKDLSSNRKREKENWERLSKQDDEENQRQVDYLEEQDHVNEENENEEEDNVLILICGRDEMNKTALSLCQQIGYKHIHVF